MGVTGAGVRLHVDSSRSKGVSPAPLFAGFVFVTSLFLPTQELLLEDKAQYSCHTLSKSRAALAFHGVMYSTQALPKDHLLSFSCCIL